MHKYTPGLIPWIALMFLLFFLIDTINKIVEYQATMDLRLMDVEVDHIKEEKDEYMVDPWLRGWDDLSDDEKQNRLRIALERSST